MDKVQKNLWGWVGLFAVVGGGLWYLEKKAAGAVSEAFDTASNDAAGLFVPDANAAAQTAEQKIMADLKANGSPTVGSAEYNQIMVDNGRPDLVVNLSQ